jgi:hypothetical protein
MSDRLPIGTSIAQSYKGQVLATDSEGYVRKLQVDPTGRVVNIDIVHDLIHKGLFFTVNHIFRDVPAGQTRYIYHITGTDKALHSQIEAKSVGKWLFESFGNPTISDVGTQLTPITKNTNSTYVIQSLFYHTPTVTDEGSVRVEEIFGSGTNPNRFTSGSIEERQESIFGSEYGVLVGFTNESTNTQDLTVKISFYETPDF